MNFRFAKDKWLSQEFTFAESGLLSYDKFQHFLGGAILSFVINFLLRSEIIGLIVSAIFWFLWEVKDGLLRWEEGKYITNWIIRYNWGGDGFSWKDMLAAWLGAGLSTIFYGILFL